MSGCIMVIHRVDECRAKFIRENHKAQTNVTSFSECTQSVNIFTCDGRTGYMTHTRTGCDAQTGKNKQELHSFITINNNPQFTNNKRIHNKNVWSSSTPDPTLLFYTIQILLPLLLLLFRPLYIPFFHSFSLLVVAGAAGAAVCCVSRSRLARDHFDGRMCVSRGVAQWAKKKREIGKKPCAVSHQKKERRKTGTADRMNHLPQQRQTNGLPNTEQQSIEHHKHA